VFSIGEKVLTFFQSDELNLQPKTSGCRVSQAFCDSFTTIAAINCFLQTLAAASYQRQAAAPRKFLGFVLVKNIGCSIARNTAGRERSGKKKSFNLQTKCPGRNNILRLNLNSLIILLGSLFLLPVEKLLIQLFCSKTNLTCRKWTEEILYQGFCL